MSSDAGGGTRPRRRFSPARQVLTLYGDYWWDAAEPMPSGALVAALGDLGVKEAAARATLSRLTKLGLLRSQRAGRRTTHQLTDRARATIADEARWLRVFGRVEPRWDGLWSVLAFTIPETQRALRHTARSRLRWLGYAPLHDGVWISPLDTAADALAALRELRVGDVTSMRARLETSIEGGPQSAWDLDAVDAAYRAFTAAIGDTAPARDAEALAERSALMLEWQRFRGLDAGLPLEVLPADWPRTEARRRFAARYDELGEAAEARMRAHVHAIAPELASLVLRHRLSAS